MGKKVKVQKFTTKLGEQTIVTIPKVIVQKLGLSKGEVLEWKVSNENKLVLKRGK